MDPLAPLRNLPEQVRAYYYRLALAAEVLIVVVAVAAGADAAQAATIGGAVLGLVAALLATANTNTSRTPGGEGHGEA